MKETVLNDVTTSKQSVANSHFIARLSMAASVGSLLSLGALHILSPEFAPSWRMVSEYANGAYSWVLSLMFAFWAISTWALAYAIWPEIKTTGGKIGMFFLIAAGVGEAMGGLFDINHPLHGLAALIGIGSLPIAAMLISGRLSRTSPWSDAKKALLWTANLTWISVLLMAVTFIIMIVTFTQSGGEVPAEGTVVTALPPGVIALVGWANRFLVIAYNAWVMFVAWRSANTN
jgi:hypothetical protein